MECNDIITYNIKMPVYLRKYEVDTTTLAAVLREHRKQSCLTISEIAEELDVPITEAEHWFRTDKYQSIPSVDVWLSLKKILNLSTDEFDKSILTIIKADGKYDMGNRIYDSNGIMPTLLAGDSPNILIYKRQNNYGV